MNRKKFEPYPGEPDVERLTRAMKRQEVDRVPNFEVLIENNHVEKILGRFAGNTMAYGGDPAKGVVDTDAVRPMKAKDYIDLCKIIGQDVIVMEAIWLPYKREDKDGKMVPVADKSVKNLKDYRKLKKPGQEDIDRTLKYLREYKEAVKGTKIGVTVLYGATFTSFYMWIIGMCDFMMACYEDRLFIDEIIEDATEYWVNLSKAVVKEGVDFIYVGDDIAFKTGLFLPHKLMEEIWVPQMARIIEPALEANIPVQFESDGKIDDMMKDLIEMGVDCIRPLDPYGIDYREYKKKYGDNVALSGNIDVEFPLTKGTPEDVEYDVIQHMQVLKPGYGYIAGSCHSIVDYIPHENFITMINAIHDYGKY